MIWLTLSSPAARSEAIFLISLHFALIAFIIPSVTLHTVYEQLSLPSHRWYNSVDGTDTSWEMLVLAVADVLVDVDPSTYPKQFTGTPQNG
ncbi:hypothetical protein L1887_20116 [Cichorium endivia]|nr:hypothetical protein L1887_20116 [Cichorium endivia]